MKVSTIEIDKLYKEWKGNSHLEDSNRQIFDSSDCTEFARFVLEHAIKNNGVLRDFVGHSEQLKAFAEFCQDNYNLEIPDRIIKDYEQSL